MEHLVGYPLLRLAISLAAATFLPDGSSWVFALPVGQPVFDGKAMRNLTAELAHAVVENTALATATFNSLATVTDSEPYRFPVKRDHNLTGPDFGTIEEAKFASIGGKSGGWFRIRWTPEARAEIEAGRVKYVSINIDEYTDQLGQHYNPVALEMSLTSFPRLQTLGTIQETLGLQLSSLALANGQTMDPTELQNILAEALRPILETQASLAEQLQAQAEQLAALQATPNDPEPEPEPEPIEEPPAPAPMAAAEQLAASILAGVNEQLAPIREKIEKFDRLNLSRQSVPGGDFTPPPAPPKPDPLKDSKLSADEKIAAVYSD